MIQKEFIESLKEKMSIDTQNLGVLKQEKANLKNLILCIESKLQLQNWDTFQGKMDIGSGVYLDVKFNNPATIILNIGLNIYVEVPLAIVSGKLTKRFNIVSRKIDIFHKELSKNQAYLKLTEDLIYQLKQMNKTQLNK